MYDKPTVTLWEEVLPWLDFREQSRLGRWLSQPVQTGLSSESLHLHKKPCMVVTSLALGKQEQEDPWGFKASQLGQTSEFSKRVSCKNKIGELLRKNPVSWCDIHSNMYIPTHIQTCVRMTKRWEETGQLFCRLTCIFYPHTLTWRTVSFTLIRKVL